MSKTYSLALGLFLLVGCSLTICTSDDCSDEIADVVSRLGAPDDVETLFESDDEYIKTYWYYCEGIAYTFSNLSRSSCLTCDVDIHTFTPHDCP